MSYVLFKMAQVESVDDKMHAGRIKARLMEDKNVNEEDLPWSFPLFPKMFHVMPKKGEMVLIVTSTLAQGMSDRFYIGPIISQPQYMEFDRYSYNKGTASAPFQGGERNLSKSIDNYAETTGSFPEKEDVAIIGRVSEDIILKEKEIDIRCGIRGMATNYQDKLPGKVIFNYLSPTYIQLKQMYGTIGVINLVGTNVNIVSPSYPFDGGVKVANEKNGELLSDKDYAEMFKQLHRVPYGDKLVEYLKIMNRAITRHVHPWSLLPPCGHDIEETNGIDFNTMLSNTLRIT